MNLVWWTSLLTSHLVGQSFVISHGKPVLATVRGARLQCAMQLFDEIACQWLSGMLDDEVYTAEMVDGLYDVVHVDGFSIS